MDAFAELGLDREMADVLVNQLRLDPAIAAHVGIAQQLISNDCSSLSAVKAAVGSKSWRSPDMFCTPARGAQHNGCIIINRCIIVDAVLNTICGS